VPASNDLPSCIGTDRSWPIAASMLPMLVHYKEVATPATTQQLSSCGGGSSMRATSHPWL